MRTPFLGPAYVARSTNLADNQLINLYPELAETRSGGKDVGAFYMTPGLDLKVTVGDGPIRAMNVMGSTLYAISNSSVYAITTAWGATNLGSLFTSSGPVSMVNNGSQVAIADGSHLYTIASNVLSSPASPISNPSVLSYQDGFGLVANGSGNLAYQSDLNDLTTWSSLNDGQASAMPDNIVTIAELNREQWFFKQTNTEVWVNAGLSGFAFQRLEGVFIETGCVAPFSVAKAGQSLIWLTEDSQGQGMVVQAQGYQPKRISTHAIEYAIQGYSTISDAIAYAYQQEGHLFYVLIFPMANVTWVYDLSTQLWHRRAAFLNGAFNRHWSNCYAFFNGLALVGDYLTGNIYALNLNTLTDNGSQRKWLRSWRALPRPSERPVTFNSLRVDMMTGVGVSPSGAPQCALRWSDDGGHNWSNERQEAVGPQGSAAKRVKFNRLGSTRRNSGLDRIFELSSSDQFNVALIGAELEAA